MKSRQSSTMPKYRQTKIAEITSTQRVIFSQALEILKPYTKKFEVRVNTTEHYELWTTHGFRSRSFHPKNHKGFLFAGAVILKKSIGLYLYALHLDGKFNEKISQEILPMWKGGSAFQLDHTLSITEYEKFRELLNEAWVYYKENGWG
ncbi:MAG TPA: hypothetical protein PLJ60_18985 [Chryseolinea sp.]|nr:hypothetical protein [Chryseolinea sp.]HPM32427.1 hypothetical protein [Chryseolinea sp.]